MLKKIILGGLVLLFLMAGGLFFAIYRANDIVASLKPRIEKEASTVLGSNVKLGKLSVSIFPSTIIGVDELKISRASDSSGGLTLKNVTIKVALLPLLSRQLEITELRVDEPVFTIIKDGSGTYLDGLPPKDKAKHTDDEHTETLPKATDKPAQDQLHINLRQIVILGAHITLDDRTTKRTFVIKDVSLKSNVQIEGTAVRIPSVAVTGSMQPNFPISLNGSEIVIHTENNVVDLGKVDAQLPGGILNVIGSVSPGGSLALSCTSLDISKLLPIIQQFVPNLTQLNAIALSARDLAATFRFKDQTLDVSKLYLVLPGAVVSAVGSFVIPKQHGDFTVSIDKADIAKLATIGEQFSPVIAAYKAQGEMSTKLAVTLNLKEPSLFEVKGPITFADLAIIVPGAVAPGAAAPGGISINGGEGVILAQLTKDHYHASSDDFAATVQGEQIKSSFNLLFADQNLTATVVRLAGFGGSANAPASLATSSGKAFSVNPGLTAVSLDRVLKAFDPDLLSTVSGTIASFQATTSGKLGPDLAASLRGPGEITFVNGALKGFNLAHAVLKKADNIPLMQGALLAYVPPQYQEILSREETPIRELKSTYQLNGKTITLQSFSLTSDIFTLESKGTLQTDGEIHLDATIAFTKDFSEALTNSIKELKKVLASDGRLIFPLTLSGKAPHIIVVPNLKQILELGAKRIIKDKALDVLDRAIGGKAGAVPGVKKALEGILGF